MSEYKRRTHDERPESEIPITPVSAYEANLAIVRMLCPEMQSEEQEKLTEAITAKRSDSHFDH